MLHVSPGVYTRIFDQSEYINGIPNVNGLCFFFADRGVDNKLVYLNGEKTFRNMFPVADHSVYNEYREGWLCTRNWVRVSASFYGMRLLPNDAAYSNLLISLNLNPADNKWYLDITSVANLNSEADLDTLIYNNPNPNVKPLVLLYTVGRGKSYNDLAINIYPSANYDNAYYIDIYDKDSNGDLVIISSTLVTMDPDDKFINGQNELIDNNLYLYSESVRAKLNAENIKDFLHGNTIFVTHNEIGIMEMPDPAGQTVVNGKAYYTGANPSGAFAGNPYSLAVTNDGGATWTFTQLLRGAVFYYANSIDQVSAPPAVTFNDNGKRYWIRDDQVATGAFAGKEGKVAIWRQYSPSVAGYWEFEDIKRYYFDGDDLIEFDPFASVFSASSPSDTDYKFMLGGSDGSLLLANGTINSTVAEQLLIDAYYGLIDDVVINVDKIHFFFTLCPYDSKLIRDAAYNLASIIRQDTMAIMHVGHNPTPDIDIARRNSEFTYNSFLVTLYGNYSKLYDNDIQDTQWFSPVYHMAKILPYTYDVADLATPPAGLNRAMIPEIQELAYEPNLGDRDNLYKEQINPIAVFKEGYVVWGQLTSQRKTSALQDLNVVIVYLYMKVTLEHFCRFYIFEKDLEEEIERVRKTVQGFLRMVQDSGLIKELVTLDVGQTPEEMKRKIIHVNIVYRPVRSIEKILLNFYVRN